MKVPDKECSTRLVTVPKTTNTTECKNELQQQCQLVSKVVEENQCATVNERVCNKVPQKSVKIVQVGNLYFYSLLLLDSF